MSSDAGRWFSLGTPVSSTNKTDRHNITEILLKVVLNTINQTIFANRLLRLWEITLCLQDHFLRDLSSCHQKVVSNRWSRRDNHLCFFTNRWSMRDHPLLPLKWVLSKQMVSERPPSCQKIVIFPNRYSLRNHSFLHQNQVLPDRYSLRILSFWLQNQVFPIRYSWRNHPFLTDLSRQMVSEKTPFKMESFQTDGPSKHVIYIHNK